MKHVRQRAIDRDPAYTKDGICISDLKVGLRHIRQSKESKRDFNDNTIFNGLEPIQKN